MSEPFEVPRSPYRSMAHRQIGVGVLLMLLASAGLAVGGVGGAGALPLGLFGAFLLAAGVQLRWTGDLVPTLNVAYNAVLAGKIAVAEGLLDRVEAARMSVYVRRVVDLQRANIALRRGDLDEAEARLERALVAGSGLLSKHEEHLQRIAAHAMRALVLASKGEVARARADIEVVRADPMSGPEALSRAAVAEAMVLEREGDRGALAAHLKRSKTMLYDRTEPRERAIVRAYRRMLDAPKASVYRQASPREAEAREEPPMLDWIARVAPSAAPFVVGARGAAEASAPAQTPLAEPDLVKLAAQRFEGKGTKGAASRGAKVVGLWIFLILFFLAVWEFLNPPRQAHEVRPPPEIIEPEGLSLLGIAASTLPSLVLVGLVAWSVQKQRRNTKRVAAALGAIAREADGAVDTLRDLARSKDVLVAAQAQRELARIAVREARFDDALASVDDAIAKVGASEATRVVSSPIFLPDLLAERAYVLAARGRFDEARAEMEVLRDRFAAFPYRASAELRVALMERVKRGDFEGAARVADAAGEDVPLPLCDETLADLARAAARPTGLGEAERARVGREIKADPALAAFVEAVSPSLLSALTRSHEQPADDDAEAEREALAVQEAEAARVG